MNRMSRRAAAAFAFVAMAFGALWPLVSQAGWFSHKVPVLICTHGDFRTEYIEVGSNAPVKALGDRVHCSECIGKLGAALLPTLPFVAEPLAIEQPAPVVEYASPPPRAGLRTHPPSQAPPGASRA